MAHESESQASMPDAARSRIRRRRVLAGSAGLVSALLVVFGTAVAMRSSPDRDQPATSAIPDVAELECRPQGGVEMPARVRIQEDGVHLRLKRILGMRLVEGKSTPKGLAIEVLMTGPDLRIDPGRVPGPAWFGCVPKRGVASLIFELQKDAERMGELESLAENLQRLDIVDP